MIADMILALLMVGGGLWSAKWSIQVAIENSSTPEGCIQQLLRESYVFIAVVLLLWGMGWVDIFAFTMFIVRKLRLLLYDYPHLIQNYHNLKEGIN